MPNTTTRLALQEPLGTDAVSELRLAITNHATTLDSASLYQEGTLTLRPLANTVAKGNVYRCTDIPCLFISDGTAWHYVPLDGSQQPVGSITAFAGTGDPSDQDGTVRWNVCDGRAIGRTAFAALFSALGTTYGAGDGSTTFNIPDMRGRSIVGAGSGAGLTTRTRGQAGGEETHVLSTPEIPVHSHTITTPNGANFVAWDPGGAGTYGLAADSDTKTAFVTTTNGTGGGGSHNNMQPYLVVNHIIKVL